MFSDVCREEAELWISAFYRLASMSEAVATLVCPITQEVMADPVIGPDGYTYERSALKGWLERNGTSPMTRQPMAEEDLVPNRALAQLIAEFKETHIDPPPAPVAVEATVTALATEHATATGTRTAIAITATTGSRMPRDFLCLVDVSGSMNAGTDLGGTAEPTGLTRLDLVIHTLKTIVAATEAADTISLITFSNEGRLAFGRTQCTSAGKAEFGLVVDRLVAKGGTNIWDALRVADTHARPDSVVILLTDGEPTEEPPRGTLHAFRHRLSPQKPYTVHTFGYGYGLKPGLLEGLAAASGGVYGYVPDMTMIGTVFVNFLAHVFVSATAQSLRIVARRKVPVVTPLLQAPIYRYEQLIGSVGFGETRYWVLPFEVEGELALYAGTTPVPVRADLTLNPVDARAAIACSEVMTMIGERTGVGLVLAYLHACDGDVRSHPLIVALIDDLSNAADDKGQFAKALEPQWYSTWGNKYLPSIIRAHALNVCINFKDASLQHYGGAAFLQARAHVEHLFCYLPTNTKAPVSMASVYTAGGCFAGSAMAMLVEDSGLSRVHVSVNVLGKGDLVLTSKGPAPVVCVIRYNVNDVDALDLTRLDGTPFITPYHPIHALDDGCWGFARDAPGASTVSARQEWLYNIVLGAGFSDILLSPNPACAYYYACATLGHGLEGPVIGHEYFARRILEDLEKLPGWDEGLVDIASFHRDPKTGLVCGIGGCPAAAESHLARI